MSKRIEFIDIAKAIFIIIIVMDHTRVVEPFPYAYDAEVPAFILLSGLFFSIKRKGEKNSCIPFKEFLIKKFKTLLLPFLFFYIASYLLFYAAKIAYPAISTLTDAKGLLDIFVQKQLFNGPLWFLLALLWIQILSYPIERYIRSKILKYIIIITVGIVGALLGEYNIFVPLYIDNALALLPFFFLGNVIYKARCFENKRFIIHLAIAIIAIIILSMNLDINAQPSLNKYGNIVGYMLNLFVLTWICITVLFICKIIPLTPLLYIGTNTMLIMCVHHLIYRSVQLVTQDFIPTNILPYFVCIVTMIIIFAIAPFFNKYIPWTVGKIK